MTSVIDEKPLPGRSKKVRIDRRLAALQQQLLSNAKSFAQQISNLKLELMELEISSGGGE